jgi:hypothetical protein
MQNQLEDDIDSEIENMKRMYEDKLAVSRETTLKYKGKFLALRFLLLLRRLLGLCAHVLGFEVNANGRRLLSYTVILYIIGAQCAVCLPS